MLPTKFFTPSLIVPYIFLRPGRDNEDLRSGCAGGDKMVTHKAVKGYDCIRMMQREVLNECESAGGPCGFVQPTREDCLVGI